MNATEQEQTLATLQRLAHLHNENPNSPAAQGTAKLCTAILLQTDEFAWEPLLEAEARYHSLVEMGDRPNGEGGLERDRALQHLADALWRLVNEGRPCDTCIKVIPGAPWEIAARAGGGYARGKCPRHVRQVAA